MQGVVETLIVSQARRCRRGPCIESKRREGRLVTHYPIAQYTSVKLQLTPVAFVLRIYYSHSFWMYRCYILHRYNIVVQYIYWRRANTRVPGSIEKEGQGMNNGSLQVYTWRSFFMGILAGKLSLSLSLFVPLSRKRLYLGEGVGEFAFEINYISRDY